MENHKNQIPGSYRSHGHTFRLVASKGMAAIYQMTVGGKPFQYEVIRFRHRPASVFRGKAIPAGLRMPSDEDWGTHGKTYSVAPHLPVPARIEAEARMEAWSGLDALTTITA